MSLVTIITLIIIIFSSDSVQAEDNQPSAFDTKLETYMNAIKLKKGYSGEILVAKGNTVLFQKALGMASIEHQLHLKNGAKYRIASITKTFTAMLIMMAQRDKKLKVEDNVIKYIPQLSAQFKDITIGQLLTHTSGLPHNEGIKDYWLIKSKLQMTKQQTLEEINQLELLFTPGSEMHYSSLGYYLLAVILEHTYEIGFDDLLKTTILSPLQMNQTSTIKDRQIIPQMASGYHWVNDDTLRVAPYRNYSMLKGAGDMYSTTTDLLKWANGIYENTLISEKNKKLIFTPQTKTLKNKGDNYGYGWYLNEDVIKKYYHGGGTWGYSTYMALYPDDKITIIILSNVSTLPITAIASDVEKIVFNRPFKMSVLNEEVSVKSIELKKYVGRYISNSKKVELSIFSVKNELFAKLGVNPAFQIYAKGDHQFFGKKIEIEIVFKTTEGDVTGLEANRMGETFQFNKVQK